MAKHLAGAPVRDAVDCRAAFEADAHAAERSARLPGNRSAAGNACHQQGGAYDCASLYLQSSAIDGDGHLL
jgi:hypothetical protein